MFAFTLLESYYILKYIIHVSHFSPVPSNERWSPLSFSRANRLVERLSCIVGFSRGEWRFYKAFLPSARSEFARISRTLWRTTMARERELHSCLSISSSASLLWKNLCEASWLILELWRAMPFCSLFLSSRSRPLSFSRSLSSAYTESPSSPLCNGESRKGEGAKSTASEEGRREGGGGGGESGMRRVRRVAWEQRKATRRKMQRDDTSLSIALFPGSPLVRVLCLFLLYYFTLCLLRFLSPFLPHPGPLPCFHDLSSI